MIIIHNHHHHHHHHHHQGSQTTHLSSICRPRPWTFGAASVTHSDVTATQNKDMFHAYVTPTTLLYRWACSQCSAPKHLTFNPTFPQKQKLFSRGVVILPVLRKVLLCYIVSLGAFIFRQMSLFRQKIVTSLIWCKCRSKEKYAFFSWLFRKTYLQFPNCF